MNDNPGLSIDMWKVVTSEEYYSKKPIDFVDLTQWLHVHGSAHNILGSGKHALYQINHKPIQQVDLIIVSM